VSAERYLLPTVVHESVARLPLFSELDEDGQNILMNGSIEVAEMVRQASLKLDPSYNRWAELLEEVKQNRVLIGKKKVDPVKAFRVTLMSEFDLKAGKLNGILPAIKWAYETWILGYSTSEEVKNISRQTKVSPQSGFIDGLMLKRGVFTSPAIYV
jgi:hypothetical protein